MQTVIDYREAYIKELTTYFGDDKRRIHHAMQVLSAAEQIMDGEGINGLERKIITITALLHDVGIKVAEQKYQSSAGPYQELEGPPVAKSIMLRESEAEELIDRVCYIVGGHHTAAKNNGLDFQVIWEADLFVNIEDDGLHHNAEKVKEIIQKNYRTPTGIKMAQDKFLPE